MILDDWFRFEVPGRFKRRGTEEVKPRGFDIAIPYSEYIKICLIAEMQKDGFDGWLDENVPLFVRIKMSFPTNKRLKKMRKAQIIGVMKPLKTSGLNTVIIPTVEEVTKCYLNAMMNILYRNINQIVFYEVHKDFADVQTVEITVGNLNSEE